MEKTKKIDLRRAALIQDTADLMGVKPDTVYRVITGKRNNERVMLVFMELQEGRNKLLDAVKTLVPFDQPKPVELRMQYVQCE